MNKHFYLKHEIMAFNDPRVQNMLRQEGGKAYGAYWYIMEKLSLLPDMEAELKYLKPFATRNFTYPYMMKIVTNFGLFTVTDSCFSPVQLNTKCVAEPQKAEENTAENSGQNGKKYPDNDVKPGKNAGFSTKNRQTMDKNRDGNESGAICNSQNNSGLSENSIQHKENIRDIITTAAKEKEISAVADKVDAKNGSIMEAYHFILLADAKKIALDDAGVSEKVTFTEETLVAGGIKSPYYYFAFESASARWTYKIDAVLGVIMDKTCDKIIPPAPEFIGLEKAKQIALEDAGLDETAQKIVFTREELSRNSGKPCYILEFYTDKCAYSYKVDAVSGDIIGKKTEWFSRQESETVPDTSQNSDSKHR